MASASSLHSMEVPTSNSICSTSRPYKFKLNALRSSSAVPAHAHDRRKAAASHVVLQLTTASAFLLVGLASASAARALSPVKPVAEYAEVDALADTNSANMEEVAVDKSHIVENIEDMELKAALESWKSKTFALTVPLRIVALRGSVPPLWIKEFISSQGKRLKFQPEFRGRLSDIFSDLSLSITKGNIEAKSAMAADIVTIGDSWLSTGINKGLIEPVNNVEEQDWFKGLSEKWKVYLRRDASGKLDSDGKIWASPYRWGSMVIAYKKNKFRKHNIAPIQDWDDLWRSELTGKISMVDSPREVVGAVLKYMGGSYNTLDIDSQVTGGKEAFMQNFMLLQKQVRLFDSVHYLKAFGVGDVWVAVGWSNDVIPAVKRMSDVAVIVPKSGASLWADLWAIPASHKFDTNRIGGRVRGPSPLVHQWMEFCLLAARALPFKQEIVPGASPSYIENPSEVFEQLTIGKPKLDTNLVAGVPPPEILAKCEFLEPLSESAMKDYQGLINSLPKPGNGLTHSILLFMSSVFNNLKPRMHSR